jgi:hypothetical protein
MSLIESKNNGDNHQDSFDSIFIDEDVQRFDADSYKEKYGDRWKKLATTVRDVVQSDGTIIREYVIDDPSMLEQLSDGEEKHELNSYSSCYQIQKRKNSIDKTVINSNYQQPDIYSKDLANENKKSHEYYSEQLNNDKNNYFKPIFSSIGSNGSLSVISDGESFSSKKQSNPLKVSSKSKIDYVSEEEVDQEVEKIHEQGIKKFELLPKIVSPNLLF